MHGLYVLWWVQQKHVSVAAVAAILAAGDLFVTVLELPTGWLADRWGHRASLITGSLLQIAGMLFAWLGNGIPGVLASSLLIAAGDAFRSGADQALLYRSCIEVGDSDFQRREAQARGQQLVVLVGFVLAGGAIVHAWGFATGWFVETAISAIGLAIACAMVEPPAHADFAIATESPSPERLTASRRTEAVRQLGSLVALIAPAAIVHAAASAGTFFVQSAADRGPAEATILIATVTLAEAAGSFVASRAAADARSQSVLAMLGIGVAGAALVIPRAFQPAVVALSFLIGLMFPLRAAAIQHVAADGVRARAASLASACDKVLATLALLLAGVAPRGRSR
jgi:MFS family permease